MIQQHDISRQLERARRLLQEGDSTRAEVTRRAVSDRSRHLDRTVVCRPGSRNRRRRDLRSQGAGPDTDGQPDPSRAGAGARGRTGSPGRSARHDAARNDLDGSDPLNWAVYSTLLAGGEPMSAALACECALPIDPLCVDAHPVLGETALHFREWGEAKPRFRLMLHLAPDIDEAAESPGVERRPDHQTSTRPTLDTGGGPRRPDVRHQSRQSRPQPTHPMRSTR